MNFLKDIKVRTKLIASYIILAALIAAVGIIGKVYLGKVAANSEYMYSNSVQSVKTLADMKQSLTEIKNDMTALLYEKDASNKERLEKDIETNTKEGNNDISIYNKFTMDSSEKKVWSIYKQQFDNYINLRDDVIKIVDSGNYDEALKQYIGVPEIRDNMMNNLNKLISINIENAKASNSDNHAVYSRADRIVIAFIVLGLIVAVSLGLIISMDISSPLTSIVSLAKDMENFDLSNDYLVTRKDEFGKTGASLAKAKENLKNIMNEVLERSQELNTSTEELSATVEELALKSRNIDNAVHKITSGLEETSAASQEVTASIEEIDSSINELSDKSAEGSNNAYKSKERATKAKDEGKDAIQKVRTIYAEKKEKMLEAIEEGKVVENIRDMADTIANIAEQTNLLSLNAAIESARAGEQGKGFAVVAQEVGKLAEQSSHAVSSIQDTIARVQNAFNHLSENSNDLLTFINEDLNEQIENYSITGEQYYKDSDFVSKMSEEIASMSEELTSTMNQVSEAVQSMSGTSQKSAEHSEIIKTSIDENKKSIDQIAQTAQSQAELAQKLYDIMNRFKL